MVPARPMIHDQTSRPFQLEMNMEDATAGAIKSEKTRKIPAMRTALTTTIPNVI
jgi:hypothetical protein